MTRENLYVGLTRGRETNTVYVITDTPVEITPDDYKDPTARSILAGIVRTVGAEKSATQVGKDEAERWGSVAQLAAEYETLAAAAQRDRWTRLLRHSGLSPEDADQVITAPAFGALTAELRRAEADGHDVEHLAAPSRRPARPGRRRRPRSRPAPPPRQRQHTTRPSRRADHPTSSTTPDRRPHPRSCRTHDRRLPAGAPTSGQALIEQRVTDLVHRATRDHELWLASLGPEPGDTGAGHAWNADARMIAAYRDRYGITSSAPLGTDPVVTDAQAVDAARSAAALRRATRTHASEVCQPDAERRAHGIDI